jgi:hypothetical protein
MVALALVLGFAASPMFLVDDTNLPKVVITWPTKSGDAIRLECTRAYRSPNEREFLDKNLECFVALGGTRLDRGIGHPAGALLRVGFYKADRTKPMFDDIADGGMIDVTLSNIHFTDAPVPRHQTAIQHVKFMADDLVSCGLGGEAVDLFNTVSLTDDLYGKITPDNGRMGGLDGQPGHGTIETIVEVDGSVTLKARLPYGHLRHIKDPWRRSAPGTFTEPQHFHVEIEVLPKRVADDEASGKIKPWTPPVLSDEVRAKMKRNAVPAGGVN